MKTEECPPDLIQNDENGYYETHLSKEYKLYGYTYVPERGTQVDNRFLERVLKYNPPVVERSQPWTMDEFFKHMTDAFEWRYLKFTEYLSKDGN